METASCLEFGGVALPSASIIISSFSRKRFMLIWFKLSFLLGTTADQLVALACLFSTLHTAYIKENCSFSVYNIYQFNNKSQSNISCFNPTFKNHDCLDQFLTVCYRVLQSVCWFFTLAFSHDSSARQSARMIPRNRPRACWSLMHCPSSYRAILCPGSLHRGSHERDDSPHCLSLWRSLCL